MKLKNPFPLIRRIPIYVFWSISLFACHEPRQKNISAFEARVTKTGGRVISTDTMSPPLTLPLGPQVEVTVGKPAIFPIRDHSQPLHTVAVTAGAPVIKTPGQDSFLLPKVVTVVHRPVTAKSPQVIVAQPSFTREYNPYNFNLFGPSQGLAESAVQSMCRDRAGNMWFGTTNGISKYNGKTFENYTTKQRLADNFVDCIMEDHDGNMWFGFRHGLSRYDGRTITNYTISEGLSGDNIDALYEDKQGNIWIGTRGQGLSRLDKSGKTFTHYTEKQGMAKAVTTILEDRHGNMWFGTQEQGLVKFDGKSFFHYRWKENPAENSIMDLMEDHDGNLWMATWSGIARFDGKTFYQNTGLMEEWFESMLEDQSGTIWFATRGGGVFSMDRSRQKITHFTQKEGLIDNNVIQMLVDPTGNIWFGCDNGLVKYSRRFSTLTPGDGLAGDQVRSVLQDRHHNIWVGSVMYTGLACFDFEKKIVSHFSMKQGLSDDNPCALLEDKKGNIWIGSEYQHLVRLNTDRKTFTHFKSSGDNIVSIFEDHDGNVWYSSRTKGGVFRINNGTQSQTHFTVQQGLCHDQVNRIFQDRAGNMWFCTFGGVSRLSKDGRTFTNYTEKEGLNASIVHSIVEDSRGDFWFGTRGGGVSRLDFRQQTLQHFSKSEGLAGNIVYGMLEDKKGNLWISIREGLNKLSRRELEKIADTSPESEPPFFKNYTAENGNTGFADARYYLLEAENGDLWIPKRDRMTIFYPDHDITNPESPEVHLASIKLYDEYITWQKDSSYVLKNGIPVHDFTFEKLAPWTMVPEHLSLAHNNNFLTFEFVGINTNAPQTLSYQYRLLGLEDQWSAVSHRSEAVYGNLPSGNYTFQVRAANEDGIWSKDVSYTFVIRSPWWEKWWMFALYACVVGMLIYAFIQYRIRLGIERIKAMEAIRIKISGDLHDDVGSILGGLAMQSEVMALTAREEDKELLNELSVMSHEAMEGMRDTVWAIDSRKDKYENLIDRMRAFAERSLNRIHITHDLLVDVQDGKKFLEPEKRQHIYLIFKEAITNIVKHSGATHVVITFIQKREHLELVVHDNGLKTEMTSTDGLGMSNMQMRTSQLGGRLTVTYKDGFKVKLAIKKD